MKKLRSRLRITNGLLIFSVVVLCITSRIMVPPVHGSSTEIRVINPDTGNINFKFYTNTTFLGSRFNVTVRVYNVMDLYAFQVCLEYDSSVLNATGARIPKEASDYVFHGEQTMPCCSLYYGDPQYGTCALVGDTIFGDIIGFDGSGLLAIIEFEIIDKPEIGEALSCDLNIDNVDTYLLDSELNEMEANEANGRFQYVGVGVSEPYLEAEPARYEAKRLEMFNISVGLYNVSPSQELVNVTFTLNYDATLLNVTKVTEGTFLAGFGDTTFNHVLESGGITIVNYLTPPYTNFPAGSGEIATITLQGIYQDAEQHSCNLKLQNIQLLNSTMAPLPFSPELTRHGSYTIGPATSRITINAPKKVVTGSNVTINGTITPIRAGVDVTIYLKSLAAIQWNILATVKTDSNSHYVYTWLTSENLTYTVQQLILYASWSGDNVTLGSETEKITMEFRMPITIRFDPGAKASLGENITITGTVKQAHLNVTIYCRRIDLDEAEWTILATVKANSEGRYNHTWITPELGKYEVKASWEGGSVTEKVEVVKSHIREYILYTVAGMQIIIVVMVLYFKRS